MPVILPLLVILRDFEVAKFCLMNAKWQSEVPWRIVIAKYGSINPI